MSRHHINNLKNLWKLAKETGQLSSGLKRTYNLWKRNNGRCHICGELVPNPLIDYELLTTSNYPTRDHVIPRAKHGSIKVKNVKLAHNKCNIAKGNTLMEDLSTRIKQRKWGFKY